MERKKKKWIILGALSLVVVIALVFLLVYLFACRDEHQHVYSEQWSHDSTYHWREPTCDDTDEVDGKATHTMQDGVCVICGYADTNTPPTSEKDVYDMSGVVFADATVVYDGEVHSLVLSGNLPDGVTVSYQGNGQVNAGEYTVTAKFTGDTDNYEPIPDMTAKLIIQKREITLTLVGPETIRYDGNSHKDFTVSAQNLVADDEVEIIISYSGDMVEVGEYTVTATIAEHTNYILKETVTKTVTISRETHKVTFRQAGQPDVVVEVPDLASVAPEQIPTPVAVLGYTVKWAKADLSCVMADIVIEAVQTLNTYTITYYLDGGTNSSDNPTSYTVEMLDIALATPTHSNDDREFKGWYLDETFQTSVTAITREILVKYGNLTLYARWGEKDYFAYDDSASDNGVTITGYTGKDTDITVPSVYEGKPVTAIGKNAFKDCYKLTSVVIPDSVTAIGESAFSDCRGLKSVVIGNNVTSIGHAAFYFCTSLESVVIPDSVTSMAGLVFWGCVSLKSVEIGNGITVLSNFAFYGCSSLESIVIPNSVTAINASVFDNCKSLTTVVVGSGVISIGQSAFDYCTALKSVYYVGTFENWNKISISTNNSNFKMVTRYYYSATEPTTADWAKCINYWYYDAALTPTPWVK